MTDVAGTLRVPSAKSTLRQCRRRISVTAREAFRRGGFTLFELILAVALSATLLALIGTAINLYLMRVDASRTQVEEAQLARSILAMIADDLRAATIHQPQNTAAIARLMANTASIRDADDDRRAEGSRGTSGTSSPGTSTSISSSSGSSSSSSGSSSSNSAMASSSSQVAEVADGTLPLGLNGSLAELYVDVTRLPRRDELFATFTGYTNAPLPPTTGAATGGVAAGTPPSDLKTVRYFVRQGEPLGTAGGATLLDPAVQQGAAGLVRQVIPRPMFKFAERTGDSALLESGQKLVAPEVVHLEFRYYDGRQVVDAWDMRQAKALPLAIEVRIWLATPKSTGAESYDLAGLVENARQYRQTVYLPMADASGAEAGEMSGGSSSSFNSQSTSAAGASGGSGAGSTVGQP